MKTVSGELYLLKSEIKAIHAIRAFALDRFDFKRNKKGQLTTKAKQMEVALDTLQAILNITY